LQMNYARIKSLQQRRYSQVSESQKDRNQERIDHASSLLSKLEEQVGDDNGRLRTAKELLSVAGSKTRTEGCNVVLSDCIKLLKESAQDAGVVELYREHMREMPDETVSEPPSVERYCFTDREEERRRRESARTESDCEEKLMNRGE
jgi:hypothetical protein